MWVSLTELCAVVTGNLLRRQIWGHLEWMAILGEVIENPLALGLDLPEGGLHAEPQGSLHITTERVSESAGCRT